jgi:hypothetical protein
VTAPHPEDIGDGRRVWPHGDGTWSISDNGVWLPGAYDTREAAVLAFDVPPAQLVRLRDRSHAETDPARQVITREMLEAALRINHLIEASSLGTPDAVAMRARTTDEEARRVVARAEELGGEGR